MSAEEEVKVMLAQFGAALNAHDAAAIARFWLRDGNFVDQWGRLAFGSDGVEQLFASLFTTELLDARFVASRLDLRRISDDTVVGECDAVWEHVRAPNGRLYDLPHRIDAVFVRGDGAWRFMSAHPSFRNA
jgi:uncharacterized protein (TIGR02246 family)